MKRKNDSNGVLTEAKIIPKSIVEGPIDAVEDMKAILAMTSIEGFDKKIELICNAEDMSTREKIQAINNAEDKRLQDLSKNIDNYCKTIIIKAGTKIFVIIGLAAFAYPQGRKVVKCVLEKAA